jgi:hypothetical protein
MAAFAPAFRDERTKYLHRPRRKPSAGFFARF